MNKNKRIIILPLRVEEDSKRLYYSTSIGIDEIEILMREAIYYFEIQTIRAYYDHYIEEQSKLFVDIDNLTYKKNSELNMNDLLFFKPETNILMKYIPQSQTLEDENKISIEVQGFKVSICKINKEYLFVYGGYNKQKNKYISNTFLVNLESKSAKEFASGINCCSASCEYFENKIYLFGGSNGSPINQSRYFDFLPGKWTSIQTLPSSSSNVSKLLLKSNILITTPPKSLYLYDIFTNKYTENSIGSITSNNNILMIFGNKITLVNNDCVYETYDINNPWKAYKCTFSIGVVTSKPCYSGKYGYFLIADQYIFRYNFLLRSGGMIKYIY